MSQGSKNDSNKAQLCLIPSEALTGMAKAFMYGAKKYNRYNFRKGIQYTRLTDAAMRHILQFLDREEADIESFESHVDHALASLAMLKYMIVNRPDMDDRYKPEPITQPIKEVESSKKEVSPEPSKKDEW